MSIFTPGTELKRFRKGKLPKIALAVLLFIPLIYGALYLWAFWAPDKHMDQLPVAVVNLDQPAEAPGGDTLAAGDDVVEQLLDGGDLDWQVLTADEADEGVADGSVYFSVTIPEAFSETLAGLQDDPQAGQLDVVYNDTNSFLASTLGKQAMSQLRDAVAETTTRTAADKILVGVEELSDGTRDAADAASTLDDGAGSLADASGKLSTGLGDLADGTAQLVSKVPALTGGTAQLADGLQSARDGSDRLAQGGSELSEKSGAAVTGASDLSTGLGELADGAKTLADKTALLAEGAQGISDGATGVAALSGGLATSVGELSDATAGLPDQMAGLSGGSAQVSGGVGAIAGIVADQPDLTLAELDAALQEQGYSLADLTAAATTLNDGVGAAQTSAQTLAESTAALNTAASTLSDGAAALSTKAVVLKDSAAGINQGAATLQTKTAQAAGGSRTLASGITQLSGGASALASGASDLAQGIGSASDGANTLASGAGQLADGATALDSGAQQANDGSSQLAAGAGKLHAGTDEFSSKLQEGADRAPSFEDGQIDQIAETLAAPVDLNEATENPVQGFGGGFAPFFIALASFVGALITWLILRPLPKRPMGSNTSGLRTVLTGFWPAAAIGVGQIVIMMLVLVFGIGLQPAHWFGMALFMLLTTLAFLSMQQMFIVLLGTAAGRVVSLVLLMLMLSSSGGTYPVETTPHFFQVLHPFMPASYVVDGLRQLVGGGIDGRFWIALTVMVGILVVSLALSAVAARRQKVWTIKRLHPELAI